MITAKAPDCNFFFNLRNMLKCRSNIFMQLVNAHNVSGVSRVATVSTVYLNISSRLDQSVDHLSTNGAVDYISFQHRQHHDNHFFLQIEQLDQQVQLRRVLRQLVLHVSEQEQEAADRVPQTRVRQRLLIAWLIT